jgi:hypothetical protein
MFEKVIWQANSEICAIFEEFYNQVGQNHQMGDNIPFGGQSLI